MAQGFSPARRFFAALKALRHVRMVVRIEYDSLMRLAEVVNASRAVADTAARLEKISHLAALLKRVPPDEVAIVIAFLSGETRQGRLGIGGALLSGMRDVPPADAPALDLREVASAFGRICQR